MRMKLLAAAATLGLVAGLASSQANANTLTLLNGTVTSIGGGLFTYNGVTYDAVQQQDKLWSGFTAGAGETLTFGFSTIGGVDTHSISVGGTISSSAPTTFGYTIAVDVGSSHFVSTASDIVQSAGKSALAETLSPGGSIAFSKDSTTSPPTYVGGTALNFAGAPTSVAVSETVTPDLIGTNISFVQNSFTESRQAPGPIPGAGFAGLFALALAGLYTRARRA